MTITVADCKPTPGAYERVEDLPHSEIWALLRTYDKHGSVKATLLDVLYTLQAADLAEESDVVESVWFQIPTKSDLSDTWIELWVIMKPVNK